MTYRKISAFLGAALALAATSAMAADLPAARASVPYTSVAVAPTFTWTGFYAGVNGGYAWTHDDSFRVTGSNGFFFNQPGFTGFRESDGSGFTGGAQAGYNYQIGSFVVGLEADINYANLKSHTGGSLAFIPFTETLEARSQIDWFGTVRARLGFVPTERLLVYGTGGLAYGSVKASGVNTITYVAPNAPTNDIWSGRESDTKVGWTLGAGVEYAITNNLTIRGEYLYVDLGKSKFTGVYGGDFAPLAEDTFAVRKDNKFSVVRAGLNWKF